MATQDSSALSGTTVWIVVAIAVLVIVAKLVRSAGPGVREQVDTPVGATSRTPSRPAPATASAIPSFDVVALGPRGSGKTLLLTSMYHQLQTSAGTSYHVTAPFDQVLLLNQWFGEVVDPSQGWPAGTEASSTRKFTFTVQTRTPRGDTLPVFCLNYLEYAGGLLTDAKAPGKAQADLLARIASAHALIGIIDGFWIRRWMDGEAAARVRLQQTITTMITLMLHADCPITFVITKWDLLSDLAADDEGRLAFVRSGLMHNRGFHDLVMEHTARRVVRLVPVSAVGPDFAELDSEGLVSKRTSGEIHPTNVDIPLAAVVPDLWEQVERTVGQSELRAAFASVAGNQRRGPAAALLELGAAAARTTTRVLGMLGPHAQLIGEFAMALGAEPDIEEQISRSLQKERRISAAERELEENRAARRRVLRDMQSRVDVLEGRLPSSRLTSEV